MSITGLRNRATGEKGAGWSELTREHQKRFEVRAIGAHAAVIALLRGEESMKKAKETEEILVYELGNKFEVFFMITNNASSYFDTLRSVANCQNKRVRVIAYD